MTGLALTKYQVIGNDYFVFEAQDSRQLSDATVARFCDRHYGVGSDGVLIFDRTRMIVRILNPDGSEAETSGNGLRIAAAHAVLEHGLGHTFALETAGRKHGVEILRAAGTHVESEVEMGIPSFTPADLPALAPDGSRRTTIRTPLGEVESILVSVGNPHCVVLGQSASKRRCLELGEYLERLPMFHGGPTSNSSKCSTVDTPGLKSGSEAQDTRSRRDRVLQRSQQR